MLVSTLFALFAPVAAHAPEAQQSSKTAHIHLGMVQPLSMITMQTKPIQHKFNECAQLGRRLPVARIE